jgi:recombination protein RecA
MSVDKINKSLEAALKQIHSKHGNESLMVMKDTKIANIDAISTGSLSVDDALGVGGVPKGRIVEIYGPEGSGKTTLALQIMAQAQKKAEEEGSGRKVAFLDVEQAMDMKYAQALGINVDELVFGQPGTGEETLDIVETLCNSGAIDVVVIDSVAAMQTQAELDGEIGDAHIGQVARLMSQGLRKIIKAANGTGTTVIFINQIRDKIGVMGYGEKTTTTGGRALKFYASVRIDVRKISSIKQGDIIIGNKVKIKVVKNKVAPPHLEREVEIYFGKGILRSAEVLDFAIKFGIVGKSGGWHSYGDSKLGNGRPNVLDKLEEEPELLQEIEEKVLEKIEEEKAKI